MMISTQKEFYLGPWISLNLLLVFQGALINNGILNKASREDLCLWNNYPTIGGEFERKEKMENAKELVLKIIVP